MEVLHRRHGNRPVTAAIYIYDDPEVIVAELIERGW